MKVIVDEEVCIGCETCTELCPEVFQMDEMKEKAEVVKPEGGPVECIEETIESCPVFCIHWEE